MSSWAEKMGAIIPLSKIETLHLCRKRKCICDPITLRNTSIPLKKETKILGVIFTRNLKWDRQAKKVVNDLKSRNNALKMICSKRRGPHMETSLQIAKSLVEGTLQHSLTIFMWTANKNISNIDTAINECYRTATGALRSTNIEALRVEGGYVSFENLAKRRTSNLISKAKNNTTHPLFEVITKVISSTNKTKKNSVSALNNMLSISVEPDTAFGSDIPILAENLPPWKRKELQINTNLAKYKKANTSDDMYKMLYEELIASIRADRIFYTDGSQKENHWCSYAVVELQHNEQFSIIHQAQLPEYADCYIAELAAIYKAVSLAQQTSESYLILTDNLGILTGLRNATNKCPSLEILRNCLYNHRNIIIAWIPGHCGIKGNEAADLAAKNAIQYPLIIEYPKLHQLSKRTFAHIQKKELMEKWQISETFLRKHQPINTRIRYNQSLSREESIKILRVRVGKTLFTSKHYYTRESPELCSNCGITLSIWHIFVECPVSRQINTSTDNVPDTLANILNPSDVNSIRRIKAAISAHQKFEEI